MNLSDSMAKLGLLDETKHSILAVDDSFVDKRQVDQSIYDAAGIDAKHIINECKKLVK